MESWVTFDVEDSLVICCIFVWLVAVVWLVDVAAFVMQDRDMRLCQGNTPLRRCGYMASLMASSAWLGAWKWQVLGANNCRSRPPTHSHSHAHPYGLAPHL